MSSVVRSIRIKEKYHKKFLKDKEKEKFRSLSHLIDFLLKKYYEK